MRDGRAFVQTTIDAARLFREGQCKALLQEARLTASDLDRAKLMFEVDRPLFHDFFSTRARFLGFTAAALLKSDGSIVEKVDAGAAIGNTIPRPDATDFEDARKNEPLCLVLDAGQNIRRPARADLLSGHISLCRAAGRSLHRGVSPPGRRTRRAL